MKTIEPTPSTTQFGNIAAAFTALDHPEQEKQLLVTQARKEKVPGSAAASRWTLDTLRTKLNRSRRPAPFRKADFHSKPVEETTTPIAETGAVAAVAPAAVPPVVVAAVAAPAPVAAITAIAEAPGADATAEVATESPAQIAAPVTSETAPAVAVANRAPGRKQITRGDRFSATVTEKLEIGVIVKLPVRNCTALMHITELAGGGFNARKRRLEEIAVGDQVQVEITRASQPGERRNFRASEKNIANQRVLTELLPGAPVNAVVFGLKEFGALVTIADGPAKGCDALIHVSQFPGRVEVRAQALCKLKVGDKLAVNVLSVKPNEKRKDDVDVRLTLRTAEDQQFLASFREGAKLSGQIAAHENGVFVVRFGRVRGTLAEDQLGGADVKSLKVGGTVRVQVVSFNEARRECVLTRRGI